MTSRMWIAIVAAPVVSAAIYAWLTLGSLGPGAGPERPTPFSLVTSAAIAGLLFEVAVVVPLLLLLRRVQWLNVVVFVFLGSVAWFAVCFLLLWLLMSASDASATAVAMFVPGVTLLLVFWLVGVTRGGA
jgi:hypothetical protein